MAEQAITAKEINELRKLTGAGMMDCRTALEESNGDIEAAIDNLRKKGQKVAAKRGDREANEGVALAATSADHKYGIAINLTSETDFVAKNQEFIDFAQSLLDLAITNNVNSIEELKAVDMNGVSVADRIIEQVGKIGEKIDVTEFARIDSESVVNYVHAGNRISVLVGMDQPYDDNAEAIGRDVAMQIAAMNPVALSADAVPQDVIDREKDIIMDQMRQDPKMEGKPDEMISKIAEGKLNAYFKENTLLAQPFVKDGSKTVEGLLSENGFGVNSFVRISIGG